MKLYNTLTRKVEAFRPLEDKKVKMYSCGPTVYNNLHIGNLSAFIYADLLRRTLAASGYDVTAVMNITDVDDKTIRDSKRDYPDADPMDALQKLTRKYEDVFKNDIERIGNDTSALTYIRATETIEEMIALTQKLLNNGIAYPADDGIYFSIKEYETAGFKYGLLQKIDRSHEHERIANDEYDKDHVSDFALWKKAEEGEPSWDAIFTHEGKEIEMAGRPGWHIECSAMSEKLLEVPFDIHTGGIDLKFPHHENEIAQSCGSSGEKEFARYFVHNNHILIDGKKMSKSLGNFYTLRDIEEKGFDPIAFRLLVLSSHYGNESNFTWEILEAAQNRLKNWQAAADLRWQTQSRHPERSETESKDLAADKDQISRPRSGHEASQARDDILRALQDNLDTPQAIATIDQYFDKSTPDDDILKNIKDLLGIDLLKPDITNEQKQLIKNRETARDAKDWAKSDELRDQLKEQGLEIKDTDHGSIWSRA